MGVQPSKIRLCLNNEKINCRKNTPAVLLMTDNDVIDVLRSHEEPILPNVLKRTASESPDIVTDPKVAKTISEVIK